VLPLAAAAILEAGTALLADVWSRARLVVVGQSGLAAALFFTAWTSSPWGLATGLAIAGAASGVACGAAQALLIVARPGDTDRAMVRWSLYCATRRVLVASAALTAVALVALFSSRSALEVGVALFAVGTTCAPHHALAFAQAYGESPEHPGTVQAMGQIFVVVDVAAPLALGAIADQFGLDAALGCLLVQPAIVLTCGFVLTSARRR
jgi:hypothetical protein